MLAIRRAMLMQRYHRQCQRGICDEHHNKGYWDDACDMVRLKLRCRGEEE